MTLANYTELTEAIAEYAVAFTGPSETHYPLFIRSVEEKLHHGFADPTGRYTIPPLRTRDMEDSQNLTFTNGSAPVPTDFLDFRNVDYTDSSTRGLAFSTPGRLNYDYPTTYGGTPAHFSLVGGNIKVRPTGTGTFPIAYYAKIPALTSDNTTNWLLTKNPFVYLYGALTEAAIYSDEDSAIGKFGALFAGQVKAMMSSDRQTRWRGPARVMGYVP